MTDDDVAAPPPDLPLAPELVPVADPADAAEPRPRRGVYASVVAVVMLALVLGYAKGALDLRSDSHHMLDEALVAVHDADPGLAAVEHALRGTVTPGGGAEARAAYDPLVRAKKRLQGALKLVNDAEAEARGSDRTRDRALRQSAEGRLGMLDAAESLLPLQARASDALKDADAAWASIQRAAVLSDQAAQAFNTHSRAGVTSSTVLTGRAESELTSAEVALRRAARTMPEADLQPLLDLVTERRRGAEESKRIDAVWLSGKVAEANSLLAKLVAEQNAAAGRRGRLPAAAGDPIRAAHQKLAVESAAEYAKARRLADEGDSRLQRLPAHASE